MERQAEAPRRDLLAAVRLDVAVAPVPHGSERSLRAERRSRGRGRTTRGLAPREGMEER